MAALAGKCFGARSSMGGSVTPVICPAFLSLLLGACQSDRWKLPNHIGAAAEHTLYGTPVLWLR